MAFYILFLLLIFISGFAALVYEVIWTRQLTLIFGVSIYAVSATLAAFMAGLAAGSYFWGRRSRRLAHPLRTYAVLEVLIGLYALAFPLLLTAAQWAHSLLPLDRFSGTLMLSFRFGLAILLLLLPTTLMGGTLPVLAQAMRTRLPRMGRTASLLYGINTLGAALGAAVAGFVWLPSLGMQASSLIAAALNFLIAGFAFRLAGKYDAPATAAELPNTEMTPSQSASASRQRRLSVAMAAAGLVGLGYEIVWTKMLILVLGNSTWAFSTTLTAYLFSLAIGSLLVAPLIDRRLHRESAVAWLLFALAVLGALSLPAFHWILKNSAIGASDSLAGLLVQHFLLAIAIMLPAALCSGMLLPVAMKLAVSRTDETGPGFGRMLAANTLGAVLGALLVATASLQWLGIQNSLLLLSAVAAFAALLLFANLQDREIRRQPAFLIAGLTGVILAGLLLVPRTPLTQPPGGYEFAYYRESSIGTLAVYQTPDQKWRVFDINNITEVATDATSMRTFKLMALLPYLLHNQPRDALVVTFGAGIVSGYLGQLSLPGLTCVEINPHAAEIGQVFAKENLDVLRQSGLQLVIEDGRYFLQTRRQFYDIITADATHPTGADSWLLYTREYYRACRERLRPGGVFLQWLPMHALSPEHYRTIIATIRTEFPHVSLWFGGMQDRLGHTLLIAGDAPLTLHGENLSGKLGNPVVRKVLQPEGLDTIPALSSLFIAADADLDAFSAGAPINTDDLPVTGFPRELPRPDYAAKMFTRLSRIRSAPPLPDADSLEQVQVERLNRWISLLWRAAGQVYANLPRSAARLIEQQTAKMEKPQSLPGVYRQMQQFLIDELYYQAQTTMDSLAAEDFLRATVSLSPAFPEPYIGLAYRLKLRRRFLEAEPVLRLAARNVPSARTFFELGTFYLELNRQREALQAYEKALQYDSRAAIVYTNMGLIYARQRRWREAARAWQQAVALNPGDQIARRNLERLQALFPDLLKKPHDPGGRPVK